MNNPHEGRALLAACIATDDNEPRLVYADWLEAHGHPRAQLIRLQLARAALDPFSDAAIALEDEEEAWFRHHEAAWLGPLDDLGARDRFRPRGAKYIDRGLLYGVFLGRVTAQQLTSLYATVPELTKLAIPATAMVAMFDAGFPKALRQLSVIGDVSRIVLYELLKRLRQHGGLSEFRIASDPWDATCAHRLASALPKLKRLDLSNVALEPHDVARLVGRTSPLENLRHIGLRGVGLGDERARHLAASRHALEVVELDSTELTDQGAEALGAGSGPGWQSLGLGDNNLTADGIDALCRSPRCRTLQVLRLGRNRLDDEAAQRLANSELPLRGLEVSRNGITDVGVHALAAGRWLHLQDLDLGGPEISVATAKALGQAPFMSGLRRLCAHGWSEGVLQAVLDGGRLTGLRTLILNDAPLGEAGGRALASCPALHRLRFLVLSRAELGNAGWSALTNGHHFRDLTRLMLASNQIDGLGLLPSTRDPFPRLRELELRDNPIDDDGFVGLQHMFPHLRWLNIADTYITVSGVEDMIRGGAWPHLTHLRYGHGWRAPSPLRGLRQVAKAHRPGLVIM